MAAFARGGGMEKYHRWMGDATETAFFRCSAEIRQSSSSERERRRGSGSGARPHTTRGAWARYRTGDVRWRSPSSAKTATFRVRTLAPRASTASSSERPAPSPLPFPLLTPRRAALSHTPPSPPDQDAGSSISCPSRVRDARERSASNTEPVIDAPRPRRRCVPRRPRSPSPGSGCPPPPSRARRREMIPAD